MPESVFTLEATPIKFGPGAVDDAGWELQRLGVTRALLVTDPGIPWVDRVVESLECEVVVFDPTRVKELATYTAPHQISEGFDTVLVNGQIARKEGTFTAVRAGAVLKR